MSNQTLIFKVLINNKRIKSRIIINLYCNIDESNQLSI